jgi:hypothetical protein
LCEPVVPEEQLVLNVGIDEHFIQEDRTTETTTPLRRCVGVGPAHESMRSPKVGGRSRFQSAVVGVHRRAVPAVRPEWAVQVVAGCLRGSSHGPRCATYGRWLGIFGTDDRASAVVAIRAAARLPASGEPAPFSSAAAAL